MMLKLLVVALAIGCAYAGQSPCSSSGASRVPFSGASLSAVSGFPSSSSPDEVSWVGAPMDWPCETTQSLYKASGKYINKNNIATRSTIYKDNAIVAMPRFKKGVAATLAMLPLHCETGRPTLSAFPCWSLQEEGNCAAFQSVVDVFMDPQDILWVLDTGIVNSLEEPVLKCQPKVVALNMATGKLVKTVDLGALATSSSRLQYVIADYSEDGRAFIYVTDAATRAILVYDVTAGRGYRVILPAQTTLGATRRDVLHPSLVRRADGSGVLIFSYLSSSRLFSIRTDYLQNGSAEGRIHDLGQKPRKMVMLGTDNGSALFFRYAGEPDIYRWDASTPFCASQFLKVGSSDGCSLATGVIPDYKAGRMRIFKSNFPDFIKGTVGCGIDHTLSIM